MSVYIPPWHLKQRELNFINRMIVKYNLQSFGALAFVLQTVQKSKILYELKYPHSVVKVDEIPMSKIGMQLMDDLKQKLSKV
jgi:hypothetical protein